MTITESRLSYEHRRLLIQAKLRAVGKACSQGLTLDNAIAALGISKQQYHDWEAAYGGLSALQFRRMISLEDENLRLKTLLSQVLGEQS